MRNLLLLLFILLLGGIIYFVKTSSEGKEALDLSTRDFRIEDTDQIHKIFIAHKLQDPLTLTKQSNGSWLMNGKHKANQNAIDNVMNFYKLNRIKFIPSENATKNIVKEIGVLGIKVEAYDKHNNLLKSFFIGGNTPDERGTYFLMEHAKQPYVLELPHSVAVLRERFLRTYDEWRSYEVFTSRTDKLKSVSIEYPKQKNHSFRIDLEDDNRVKPFYPDAVKYFEKQNQNVVDSYIAGFDVVYSQNVYNEFSKKDSISQLVPFAKIGMVDQNDKTFSLSLYSFDDIFKPHYTSSPTDLQRAQSSERFYGYSSEGDLFVIQTHLIKKLLRSYAYFFEE